MMNEIPKQVAHVELISIKGNTSVNVCNERISCNEPDCILWNKECRLETPLYFNIHSRLSLLIQVEFIGL